ncbi:MAG: TIGR00282 family metallophosphoesterase, partial [Oscillospiraceae bacterium]
MRVFLIGDVIGQQGCDFVREKLPLFKKERQIDAVIANGENSAVGNGILPHSANFLLNSGVDVLTSGNHVFKRREIQEYMEEHPNLVRPANYPAGCYGNGYFVLDGGNWRICVINVLGQVYMDALGCPFKTCDQILKEVDADCYVVDIHAEATGEKMALGYYLDGRVSAVVGTHTHVQTSDETILPNGTGYISDLGMTGPIQSILGIT